MWVWGRNLAIRARCLALAVVSFSAPCFLGAEPGASIPLGVEGALFGTEGLPVTSPVTLTLRLYSESLGGDVLHEETGMATPDSTGRFFRPLGTEPGSLLSSLFAKPLWLGVSPGGGGTELQPRSPLMASPWAVSATIAEELVTLGDLSLGGHTVTGIGEPSSSEDAATRSSVDQGRFTSTAVRAALTEPGDLAVAGRISGLVVPGSDSDLVDLATLEAYHLTSVLDDHGDVEAPSSSNPTGAALVWTGETWAPGLPDLAIHRVVEVPVDGTAEANGALLRSQLAAAGSPSPTEPLLIQLAEGVYDIGTESLLVQPFTVIAGAGPSRTRVVGSPSDGVLRLTTGTALPSGSFGLRGLEVRAIAGGAAIHSGSPGAEILGESLLLVSDGQNPTGLFLDRVASANLTNLAVELSSEAGGSCVGIHSAGSPRGALLLREPAIQVDCTGPDSENLAGVHLVYGGGLDQIQVRGGTLKGVGDQIHGLNIFPDSEVVLRDLVLSIESTDLHAWGIRFHSPASPGTSLDIDGIDVRVQGKRRGMGIDSFGASRVQIRRSKFDVFGRVARFAAVFLDGWSEIRLEDLDVRYDGNGESAAIQITNPGPSPQVEVSDVHAYVTAPGNREVVGLRLRQFQGPVLVQHSVLEAEAPPTAFARGLQVESVASSVPLRVIGGRLAGADASLLVIGRPSFLSGTILAGEARSAMEILCSGCRDPAGDPILASEILAGEIILDENPPGLESDDVATALTEVLSFVESHPTSPTHFPEWMIQISPSSIHDFSTSLSSAPEVAENTAKVSASGEIRTHEDVAGPAGESGDVLFLQGGSWSAAASPELMLGDTLQNGGTEQGESFLGVGSIGALEFQAGPAVWTFGLLLDLEAVSGESVTLGGASGTGLSLDTGGTGTVQVGTAADSVRAGSTLDAGVSFVAGVPESGAPGHLVSRSEVDARLLLAVGDTLGVRRQADSEADCPAWGTWSYEQGSGDVGFCTLVAVP